MWCGDPVSSSLRVPSGEPVFAFPTARFCIERNDVVKRALQLPSIENGSQKSWSRRLEDLGYSEGQHALEIFSR